ncbi:MAG TPA: DUF1476 domain-containing protein [Stellaceae bacterium]|jgi:hypothetical protein|nr:DUF1476 domain-containing protein [Stellaceae bacterium]
MSSFDEREKDFEARFKHDQELAFKVTARRNKLLGLWAAQHLGLTDAAADAYAAKVVAANFTRPGDSDVIEKVAADFAAKGISLSAAAIADELRRCFDQAKMQVMKG